MSTAPFKSRLVVIIKSINFTLYILHCNFILFIPERRISGKAVFTVEFTEDPIEEDNEDKY